MTYSRTPVAAYDDDDDYGYDSRSDAGRGAATRGASHAHMGLPMRIVAMGLAHPIPTLGILASVATVITVGVNAMGNQPGHHPAPLFETRPFAAAGTVDQPTLAGTLALAQPPVKPALLHDADAPIQTGALAVAQPRMKPVGTPEPQQILKDLQQLMAQRGFYHGEIDGLPSATTSDAIKALERSLGLVQTGEPSLPLLTLARDRAAVVQPAPQPQQVAVPAPLPPKPIIEKTEARGVLVQQEKRAIPVHVAAPVPPAPIKTAVPVAAAQPAPSKMAIPVIARAPVAQPPAAVAGKTAVPVVAAAPASTDLARIQKALVAGGYGQIRTDGRFDDKTALAIRRYEAARGWPQTGKVTDKLSLDLLMKSASR